MLLMRSSEEPVYLEGSQGNLMFKFNLFLIKLICEFGTNHELFFFGHSLQNPFTKPVLTLKI